MPEFREVNINCTVRVKLTAIGLAMFGNRARLWNAQYEKLRRAPLEPKLTADGYYECQLWELMEQFGSELRNGGQVPFETTILVGDLP